MLSHPDDKVWLLGPIEDMKKIRKDTWLATIRLTKLLQPAEVVDDPIYFFEAIRMDDLYPDLSAEVYIVEYDVAKWDESFSERYLENFFRFNDDYRHRTVREDSGS